MEGGTLLQLRNLINRRNISSDINGKFNAAIDFLKLVLTAHVLAAAIHYFGMSSPKENPTRNAVAFSVHEDQWVTLKHAVEQIVDCFVMVKELTNSHPMLVCVKDSNPHAARVASEHNYFSSTVHDNTTQKKRKLPQWLSDVPVSVGVKKNAPDGVYNYACAISNDGLLLLELRDAICEGDGPRVIRCWKFMLLHWRHAKHTKYSLEVLITGINSTATK